MIDAKQIGDIADYVYNEIDDCDDCPLEKICDTSCKEMWIKFLRSKDMVKEN